MKKWPPKHDRAAWLEGWNVFLCDDNKIHIQLVDDPSAWEWYEDSDSNVKQPVFATDDDAITFVKTRAKDQDGVHARLALDLTSGS